MGTMSTRINTGKAGSRGPRVRIIRAWRGYPVGVVLSPPASARQIMLQHKDPLGRHVAEEVVDDIAVADVAADVGETHEADETPGSTEAESPETVSEVEKLADVGETGDAPRAKGRARK